MKVVKVEIAGAPPPLAKVFVDTKEVDLVNNSRSIDVAPGEHQLVWEVVGAPGQQYSVAITSPDEAKWSGGPFTIPLDHDEGAFTFTVNA